MNVHSNKGIDMNNYCSDLSNMISDSFETQIKEPNMRKIILSALEVFSKKSVEATKIKDIAQHAGFSQGYIYNYFRSKEDLFSKIVELAAEGGVQTIIHADSLPITSFNKLCTLAEVMTDLTSLSVQHFRLTLMIISSPDSIPTNAKNAYSTCSISTIEALVKIILAGQKKGEIVNENPATLAITFFSVVQGLLLMKIQAKDLSLFPTTENLLGFMKKIKE